MLQASVAWYVLGEHVQWVYQDCVDCAEVGNLLANNQRQRRTCYALCHILYPVSAALASFFRMGSISISFTFSYAQPHGGLQGYLAHKNTPTPLGTP